jgi:transposase-like protein
MTVFEARPAHIPFRFACEALGLNRSTVYAWRRRQSTAPDPARRSRKTTPQQEAVHINPITSEALEGETSTTVNFSTLPAARKTLERASRG